MIPFLPISIEKLHDDDIECLVIEGTMLKDFGPWKRGETKCLTFNFDEGQVTEYAENGEVIHRLALALRIMWKCSQNCGEDAIPPHPCPLAEIDGDSETLCRCCEVCTQQCADDI